VTHPAGDARHFVVNYRMLTTRNAAAESHAFGATFTLLLLLVVVDLIFILVHAMHAWSPWMNASHFSLESESGMAAQYQYTKQVWLSICLGLALLQTRRTAFFGWGLIFAFLLLDDILMIHERSGRLLAGTLGFPALFGLRPQDLGEVVMAAAIGIIAIALVVIVHRRGEAQSRQLSADLMFLLVALAVFGVFFDVLHTIMFFRAPALAQAFSLVEDGGEMLVVSLITAYVFDITSNGGRLRLSLWSWVRSRVRATR
jgi:hypothetical protein